MNKSQKILSDITVFNKYAKYIPELERRESWNEICMRYESMMIKKYPELTQDILVNMNYIKEKKVLPSMRALQFAGPAIEKNNSRIYNCCFLPINTYHSFGEIMFLLLGGTGVGYSVQFDHVNSLPEVRKPIKTKKYLIGDSLEGWADAVKALIKAYLDGKYLPIFDFSDIRPKGARLITAGGRAPGPEPLKDCLHNIKKILDRKSEGDKLSTLDCHDICCYIADAVLSGGIRRSAMISLFSFDDDNMLTCKFGDWWELNPQRARANNSVVALRHRITKDDFFDLWKKIELSNSGEPGILFSNDKEIGVNPCAEISLRPYQMCNLTEINGSDIENQEDFEKRAEVAAFFGTLQAGFTDFHYLRDIWRTTTEKEALIGVGITGIASNKIDDRWLKYGGETVKIVNKTTADRIGINKAARCTTVKPSGTTSCVLGTSSGIHGWHSDYYIRRMRIGKNEALYTYLSINAPELLEDDYFKPKIQAIITIPQAAPEGSILRDENVLHFLERIKTYNTKWIKEGHRKGANSNNVSATISIKPDEWSIVGEWMWNNRDSFNGLSVIPWDNGSYVQAPFEEISEEKYQELVSRLHNIDLIKVIELEDDTILSQELACSGNNCEII